MILVFVIWICQKPVETPGFEPGASYMRSKRSTAELRPQRDYTAFKSSNASRLE